jgi:uncharacterized damage-inducible protein DinB
MNTGLPDFFKYNLWANLRLLDACAHLTDAQLDATMIGTFGSVRETLMHLFSAEEGYARSLTGTSPTPLLKELTTFPGLDHAIDHRSQISTLLSQLNIEPPDLDAWAYNDATYERS